MLRIDGLTKSFDGKVAVNDVTLAVPAGAFVGIIGRSGAGKSTLLRMINRLTDPTSGSVALDDVRVPDLKGRALRDWRAQCAMIFQQFNLVGRLDVLTNVLLGRLNTISTPRAMLGLWSDEDKARALSALEQFDIAGYANQRADRLSGGQQQRVAIARAFVQQPRIILADEPVASLDPRNSAIVMDALQRINRHLGITVLCNLHSLDIARTYCDRVVGMASGRVVFDGAPATLTDAASRDLYGIEAHDVVGQELLRPEPEMGVPAAAAA